MPTLGLEVTGLPENSESIFERLQLFLDCDGEEESDDCFQGLDGPLLRVFGGIALSPDGTLLAAAGAGDDALSLWQVDADGTIARTALYCNAADNCQGGTAVSYGLSGAHDLAFSRDNGLLFVAANGERAISVWRVDADAGALTRTAAYWDSGGGGRDFCEDARGDIDECSGSTRNGLRIGLVENGGFLADGLHGAYDVAASPTHDLLFVTASLDDALSVWEINPQAGTLIQRALYKHGSTGATSCGNLSGANCEDELEGLDGVRGVAVSPDGSLVFAAAFSDAALSVWQVAPGASGTGILARTELYEEDEPELSDVAVSPNGRLVFATDINENSLIVWRVNAESGTLTRTALYYDTNTSGCTNELREQGNCFDGLTSARNVTLSRDGRLLFVTAVTDDSLSAYEVDYTGGTLRQTALNRVRSDVLTVLNPATGVIVGPFSTVDTATGLLNPAGVAASTAGIVFVKAGSGTAIGALSTWRPIPLVPAYSLVVLTVTADMAPGMPVAATVTAVMQQGSRSVLVPVTLSSTSAEASFPADMLTPGLWDFMVLAAPGAANVALAKASLRAAPLTLRLTREQQGDQVNLRATTVEGAPITTVTVTVDAILRAEAATSASVTFMLSPQNFQDVLAQFPAASLPSGEYGFSITSSPVGIVNTVSIRSPLTVRDYTLSLAAPLEVRATKEFVVTLSAAPALETTLDVTVTLTASEIATQTRSVDLTPAAPSQNLMFTAPDVSIPTTIFLNTVTVAESTAVTGAEADTVDVRVLPPLPRLVLTPSQVGSQLQVQLATARGIPAATVAVTVKAVLRGTGTSETVTITLGPGTDAASAVFPLGALPPGTYDFSITASPPGVLDTDTVEGETTLMVELGASFTLPGGAILPAGSTVTVMITLNGEAPVSVAVTVKAVLRGTGTSETVTITLGPGTDAASAVFPLGALPPGTYDFSITASPPDVLDTDTVEGETTLVIEEPVVPTLGLEVTGLPENSESIFERLQLFLDCDGEEESDDCLQGLDGPSAAFGGIALSPDGTLLAAAGAGDDALSLWQVDADGTIARTALYCNAADNCQGGTAVSYGLSGAHDLAFSRDNGLLFVAARGERAISVWRVDADAGALTRTAAYWDSGGGGRESCEEARGDIDECSAMTRDGLRIGLVENGGFLADGLNGAYDVAASPTHDLLFVTASSDDALSVWQIDPQAGTLIQLALYKHGSTGVTSCGNLSGANCEDELEGLDGVRGVAVSPDGSLVFAAAFSDAALSVWQVAPGAGGTGILTRTGLYEDEQQDVNGFDQALSDVAVSPNGRLVFATGINENSLIVWRVNAESGTLTRTALYYDTNTSGCTNELRAQGNCFDGLSAARNVTLSRDGRRLFVTAVSDNSLSAYEVDYTGGTLRQTALNRVRSDVLTVLNPATGVIVGPFSTVGTATGLLNPAGVAASIAGIVFVKAGSGTAIGALSTWRPIPLVPAYSLVVLTVTADMVPGMPVAATVTAVMQQGSRSVLVPVTLSNTSAEASFPADMLTPGLWDFTVLAAPGAADVALAKASLRAAPLTLRLTREQQGDQVNLRATTVEGAPITTVTVTVDAILRAEAATSASVTFMLSPQNFQDVLAQFPAASLPSGEYGFSITSSPVGIVNTVSIRSPLTVRDYTLSLAAPLEVRATKEFVVTLSAAPALETTLDVTVTLTASEIATQTRSVDLTPAAPSQNLMFTAPDVSIPTTIFLNTVTVAESTAVTGAEADTVDVRVLPPLPRLVLTPSQVGSQLQVQLATARGIPAATVAVTVKAVLRGTGTSETVTITLGPGTDAASAVFPLGALPPGTYDFSITASPPGVLDTDTVEGETTLMVELGASFTLPGGAILPAGSTVTVMITLNGEASISQVFALLLGAESGQQVTSKNILSFPMNAPVKMAVFSAGMLAPGMWSFAAFMDLNIRATSSSPALLIEEPVMVTLVPDTASVSAGAEVRLVVTALSQLAESLGDVLLTVTADGISGLASGRSEMQMLTLSSSITEGAVVFPRLASGRWRISGEDERGAVATTEAEVEVVLSVVSIRPTAPQIDVDGTRQHAVAVGDDVRLQLTADPAPGTEVMLTVSAIPAEGNTGTTMTATAMLSPTASMAEAVFSGASVLSAGTWQFSAAASLADTLVLQAAPMVEVLVPRITLTQQGGMEVVPVTRPVRLEVASVPLAPGMNVAINVQAMLGESSTSQEIMLSPETASVQVEFTPSMLGQVGEWVFTATTAVPNGFVDISGASLTVMVGMPVLLLVPTTEFVSTESTVQLTVRTDAPIQSTVDITVTGTVTGMSPGKADVVRTIQLNPGNSEEIPEGLADFGVLTTGVWTFTATATPQNVVDNSRAEATVTVVESGNILSNVLLVPGQIIQGAAAVLRVVKVGASADTQTFTVLRDGVQEAELIIPANEAEAEVQVRGDGIGEYTYSLGDPESLLVNEDSEDFSQQLRVLANVQLSLAPAVGDIAYVGQASRVSAALVDTDGNAVGLATSVTLSLQAAADSGEVIAGIPLIIAPSATSGAAMFIPTVGTTWTVTVRELSPQDALLVPVDDIAPAVIVVQDQLRLVLMPATSSILIGSAATLTVMVGTAADVEVTMLEVRAVQNGRPTVSAQPDSLDLPAAVVFGVADLAPGDWELELIAEPAMAIVASTAKITVRDADLDLSTSSGEAGVGADDLVLILRHAVLCQGGSTCPDDIADLVRNLDGVAADYDLDQLPALDVPDVAADGVAEARRDISILLDYLSGIEEEVLFPPPAVSADQRERLRKVIRHILEIEPL